MRRDESIPLINKMEMGVEQKADVVLLHKTPGERGGDGVSHSVYEIRKQKTVRTAVHKGSGLATDEQTDLSRGANDDVIVTDVNRRGEKMMRIINIYDQRDAQTGE